MLGWEFFVFRQKGWRPNPSWIELLDLPDGLEVCQKGKEERALAVWRRGLLGTSYFDDLVSNGEAEFLGGDGYPLVYLVSTKVLLPLISANLRDRTMTIRTELIAECAEDEPLIVEVWDQS